MEWGELPWQGSLFLAQVLMPGQGAPRGELPWEGGLCLAQGALPWRGELRGALPQQGGTCPTAQGMSPCSLCHSPAAPHTAALPWLPQRGPAGPGVRAGARQDAPTTALLPGDEGPSPL